MTLAGNSTDELVNEFGTELRHCRQVYSRSAAIIAFDNNHLIQQTSSQFLKLMQDLYRGLMLKLFFSLAYVDGELSKNEEKLANIILFQLFQKQLRGKDLRVALDQLTPYSESLDWRTLVAPFANYEPLENEIVNLETSIVRIGNLIVKADGKVEQIEKDRLNEIQSILMQRLKVGQHNQPNHNQPEPPPYETVKHAQESLKPGQTPQPEEPATVIQEPAESLEDALEKLNELIGLEEVKTEVNQLINFIKIQQMREEQGLAKNKLSLHMVFGGNPGTGKTTVARLLGKIYGAMGVLKKGHLVETDRSGLVAEYSGQTGPKTNKVIDTAMDGVLFIDEAYSLIADSAKDPFGHEAVQALLKRMEDNRDRLIVILAGYPNEMTRLLESNPGLSSRFAHRIDFEDYTPEELTGIWHLIAKKNQYEMQPEATAKLLIGLQWLFERRDKHFGNGRLVRNAFEKSIRHLADRIVEITPITKELLTHIEADDVRFADVPEALLSDKAIEQAKFSVKCPGCETESQISTEHLCRSFSCKECKHEFTIRAATPLNAKVEEQA